MTITGDEILQAALEAITNERAIGEDATDDLDVIARRSRFVIDSANLLPGTVGQRAESYDVDLAFDTEGFTWGIVPTTFTARQFHTSPRAPTADRPGDRQWLTAPQTLNDVDYAPGVYEWDGTEWTGPRLNHVQANPPSSVRYWAWWDGTYERMQTPDGRLTPINEWRHRSYYVRGGWPRLLFWQRNLNSDGLQEFEFAPRTDARYTVRVYATVPAITQVERGQTYDLPQGVAAYIIALLAIDGAKPFGFEPSPAMYGALKAAERELKKVPFQIGAVPTSPDWMNLDGRATTRYQGRI